MILFTFDSNGKCLVFDLQMKIQNNNLNIHRIFINRVPNARCLPYICNCCRFPLRKENLFANWILNWTKCLINLICSMLWTCFHFMFNVYLFWGIYFDILPFWQLYVIFILAILPYAIRHMQYRQHFPNFCLRIVRVFDNKINLIFVSTSIGETFNEFCLNVRKYSNNDIWRKIHAIKLLLLL